MSKVLNIALSGLRTSRKGIKTTAHNVANANTEGYSRQRVHQQANSPSPSFGYLTGSGVAVKNTKRVHDMFAQNRLINANSQHNFNTYKTDTLKQVENIFTSDSGETLGHIINKFYNSFRELANQPEDITSREIIRENTKLLINDIKRIGKSLDSVATNSEIRIKNEIENINNLSKQIAEANHLIGNTKGQDGETNDLEDIRDKAIKELSNYFTLDTYEDKTGHTNVLIRNVGSLISGARYNEIGAKTVNDEDGARPKLEVFFRKNANRPITSKIKYGKIAAMLDTRENIDSKIRKDLDEITYNLIKSVNAIHQKGYARDESGKYVDNINFFKPVESSVNASTKIELSDDIKKSSNLIATAINPDSPGDNRVALAITELQHEKIMDNGESTIDEKYLSTVGKIGLEVGKSKFETEQSIGLLNQAESIKESVSGVSLDEEAENMIKYQNAYQAASKIMQVSKNMFDTIVNLKV